jgi:hypothetical protein
MVAHVAAAQLVSEYVAEAADIERVERERRTRGATGYGCKPSTYALPAMPARSSPGRGNGTPWGQEARDRAGLFEICVFRQLRDVLKALYGDQSAELNVFAISSEANARRLAQTLRRPARPSLAECLTIGEMAVYLAVSNDSAITDVIVVQALNEIDELLVPLIAEYQAALQRFEETVDKIPDSADFSRRIAELLALDRAGHNSRWAYWHTPPPWAPPQR